MMRMYGAVVGTSYRLPRKDSTHNLINFKRIYTVVVIFDRCIILVGGNSVRKMRRGSIKTIKYQAN